MVDINKIIRQKAILRLSSILKIPVDSLNEEMRFQDIKPSFVSTFKRNEFDIIHDDTLDVANSIILEELESGDLIIKTIDDYIKHMIRCYSENPNMVTSVLGKL